MFLYYLLLIFVNTKHLSSFENMLESDFLGIIAFREDCQPRKVPYWLICMLRCFFILMEEINDLYLIPILCCTFFCRDFSYNHLSGSFPSWVTQKNLQLYVWVSKFLLWTVYSSLFEHKSCLTRLNSITNRPCMLYFGLRNLVANDFVMDSSNDRWTPFFSFS